MTGCKVREAGHKDDRDREDRDRERGDRKEKKAGAKRKTLSHQSHQSHQSSFGFDVLKFC